ncbi:hypothetical protein SAMN04487967_3380 [Natronorubrum sediminis]|uniref:ParB-like nuclease domain-containing protein n=1 Tax=Natronorubrum sediminis TaxID=640943 RepID=A0A1H6G3Y1_9EURY|nr:hypothetical protein [Natronorubrum sediminis]SEH17797.1 hypothetical protein SAMN04487967_3380 [Natronorubrum sediminis]
MTGLVRKGYETVRNEGLRAAVRKTWTVLAGTLVDVTFPHLPPLAVEYYFDAKSVCSSRMSDANPTRPVWVDPGRITYYHGSGPSGFGRVVDGDWDEPECRFDDHVVHRSLRQRYDEGRDWSETELYDRYADRIDAGDPYWRCRTDEELEAYLESIDELYGTISENGYESQRTLLSKNPDSVRRQNTDAPHPVIQEIGVNIYRDGTMAKKGAGFHRLSIAKLVGVERVPVTVRVRHAEWQSIRDEITDAESIEQLSPTARDHLRHPDVDAHVPDSLA